jgi:putative tryptophan/tyrosine transport system substrate-binding protein
MRRTLILLSVALALGLSPAATPAQQPNRVAIVGVLVPSIGPRDSLIDAMRSGLRELGYVEGQNVRIEFRSAEGKLDRLPVLAEELVRLKVDVIVAGADPAIRAARRATTTIPIVMVGYVYDPVASGLIDSYGKPGGNLTGVFARISELVGKRFEILKEVVPNLSRVAVFLDVLGQSELGEVEPAARSLGLQVIIVHLQAPYDFRAAFNTAKRKKADAVVLLFSSEFYGARNEISASALKVKLATATGSSQYTEAGGLLSYGPEGLDVYHRVAYFVDRLLKGARPSDLPVEQTAAFRLVVNLKTAEALGLTIPPSILLRADTVIR